MRCFLSRLTYAVVKVLAERNSKPFGSPLSPASNQTDRTYSQAIRLLAG